MTTSLLIDSEDVFVDRFGGRCCWMIRTMTLFRRPLLLLVSYIVVVVVIVDLYNVDNVVVVAVALAINT